MQIGLQVGGLKNFGKFQWHGFGHSSAKKGHHVFKLEYYTENTGMETLSPYYSHPLIDSVATCFLIFDFFLFYLHCCLLGALDSQTGGKWEGKPRSRKSWSHGSLTLGPWVKSESEGGFQSPPHY